MTSLTPDTHGGTSGSLRSARRHDIYANGHRALRLFMADTLSRLGRMDIADAAEFEATITQMGQVLDACRTHINKENRYLHAAIEARLPARSRSFSEEHASHIGELNSLQADADALLATPDVARARRLYRDFALFFADKLRHMDSEETLNNEALWSVYSDHEIQAIELRLFQGLNFSDTNIGNEVAILMRWMNAAIPPIEWAAWVAELQRTLAPQTVSNLLEAMRNLVGESALANSMHHEIR